jgi:uridine phosphorylase
MCGIGDVARYVFLPGDPNRVERIASFFDKAQKVAEYRGFITYTGETGGVKMSACSTGIGCPSAAIVVEELINIDQSGNNRLSTTPP